MLFFIDETWQTIAGRPVGALGAIGIPRAQYNGFCREIWQIKKNVLGAKELSDGEIKGTHSFAKSAFHKREGAGFSRLLQAADLIAYLAAHRHNPNHRPELADYWTRVQRIAFATKRSGPALRAVDAIPDKPKNGKRKGPGEAKPPKRR